MNQKHFYFLFVNSLALSMPLIMFVLRQKVRVMNFELTLIKCYLKQGLNFLTAIMSCQSYAYEFNQSDLLASLSCTYLNKILNLTLSENVYYVKKN